MFGIKWFNLFFDILLVGKAIYIFELEIVLDLDVKSLLQIWV